MMRRGWTFALLTAVTVAAFASSARAADSDLIRLTGGNDAITTTAMGTEDEADTIAVRGWCGWRGGCGWGGCGWRSCGWGGGWRGCGWGGWGGWCAPRFYSWGYCAPWRSYCFSPVYAYSYAAPYFCAPTYYSYGNWPMAGTVSTPSVNLGLAGPLTRSAPAIVDPPPAGGQPAPGGAGTFQYNGGPANPVPMPQAKPMPPKPPAPEAAEDRPISQPVAKPAKFAYPAYGDSPTKSAPASRPMQVVNRGK
jgi:hypothetical protein